MKQFNGLSNSEVLNSRKLYGSNSLSNNDKNGFMKLLIESFGDPIIKILLIVLAVKTVFLFRYNDWFETLGIVIAILLASFISTISEYGSEKAFEKLQEESSKIKCKVRRNGEVLEVFIDNIVVGDIVILSAGDRVCADGEVLDGSIYCDESSFTGETKDIEKVVGSNVYRGSIVLSGYAIIKVVSVGINSKYGGIAMELTNKNPESPLRSKLRELANTISKIGYTGAILVFFSYLFSVIIIQNNFNLDVAWNIIATPKIIFGHIIYALTLAVTIIIVSVPEGLPMMIALVLSSNMRRMVKNNVLVRRMVGIETSGRIDTLFSDKTGTITKGQLEVVGIVLANGKVVNDISELNSMKISDKVLLNMKANNESEVDFSGNIVGGNITDRALMSYAYKFDKKYSVIKRELFNSSNKYSSVLLDDGSEHELFKGAPEVLIKNVNKCYLEDGSSVIINKDNINNLINKYTSLGYRVLMLTDKVNKYSDYMILISLVLLKDEISDTAKEATSLLKSAGIHMIMITGDAKETAINIGSDIGLIKDSNDLVLTSSELNNMDDETIKLVFDKIKIVARALPNDKSRLVKLASSLGHIVGMTGDGVNDAPALKCADVGFAMGSGSEIAKEASDIVILDNNLLSITNAILFGRTILKSIRKFIIFQLTMNICALTLSIIGPFLGISTPVTVMQMLWINMIMDTLAGLAFSFEAPLKEYLENAPLNKGEPILNKYMYSNILVAGIYTAILLIMFLKVPFFKELFRYDINDRYLMTAFFGLFVFSGVFNAFNARTNRINLFANIFDNKPYILIMVFIVIVQVILLYNGGITFRTYGLSIKEFMIMIILSISVIPVDITRKFFLRNNKTCNGV